MSEFKKLKPAFEKIEESAVEKEVEIDTSFVDELENYSLHHQVRKLDEAELRRVIEGIGELAIPERGGRAGGGHIRDILIRLCSDPFST